MDFCQSFFPGNFKNNTAINYHFVEMLLPFGLLPQIIQKIVFMTLELGQVEGRKGR